MITTDKIKTIIAEQLGVNEEEVKPESKLIDDLGADSLDTAEILMGIEEEFNVDINDDDAKSIKTVGDWYNYAENNFKGAQ